MVPNGKINHSNNVNRAVHEAKEVTRNHLSNAKSLAIVTKSRLVWRNIGRAENFHIWLPQANSNPDIIW